MVSCQGSDRTNQTGSRAVATALTAVHLHDALARMSNGERAVNKIAERVYVAVGFRDLGQILEYVP